MFYKKSLIIGLFLLILSSVFPESSKSITLASNDWAPYHSSDLENQGFFTEIVREAFFAVGYDLEVLFYPWNRVITLGKRGNLPGIIGAYYSKERADFFYYSELIYSSTLCFTTRSEAVIDTALILDDSNIKIGVTRGYFYSDAMEEIKDSRVIFSYSDLDSLTKLLFKRIDVAIFDKEYIEYIINHNDKYRNALIVHTDQPVISNSLHVVINKEYPNAKEIIEDFNRGLEIIKDNGLYYDIILKH
ncbi:MAG: hypothetical protein B6229_02775 [Spirochaetaceae bacterium 4572_7]|nr:MAG: hypothetical protein B6229_02775 [Spirochaetaceae bacterium 4572_7]